MWLREPCAPSHLALQYHAAPHRGTDEQNLGHLRHQSDNQRLAPAGFGAELKSEHRTALRAGNGLLLSSSARIGAKGAQMDSREAQAQIESSVQLLADLALTAQKHNARLKDENPKDEAEPARRHYPDGWGPLVRYAMKMARLTCRRSSTKTRT